MREKIFIIKGAKTFDDLKAFGLPMADRVAKADIVIAIDEFGTSYVLKSRKEYAAEFMDGAEKMSELARLMRQMNDEYIAHRPPDDHRVSHAIVALWFFFWMPGAGIVPTPIELAAAGDLKALRESAKSFIDADFGLNVGVRAKMPDDGETDATADRVFGALGDGTQAQ